jgi:hypothetical protein
MNRHILIIGALILPLLLAADTGPFPDKVVRAKERYEATERKAREVYERTMADAAKQYLAVLDAEIAKAERAKDTPAVESLTAERDAVAAAAPSPTKATRSIRIPATQRWTAVGEVKRGQVLKITASGEWAYKVVNKEVLGKCGPDGDGRTHADLPSVALIGKIGDGDKFLIGSSFELKATRSGTLFLGCNDSNYEDNDGAIEVTISLVDRVE